MSSPETSTTPKDLLTILAYLGLALLTAFTVLVHCVMWVPALLDHLTAGLDKNITGVLRFTLRVLALPFRIIWFVLCLPWTLTNLYRYYRNVVFNWSLPVPPVVWGQILIAVIVVGTFASLPLAMHVVERGLPGRLIATGHFGDVDDHNLDELREILAWLKRSSMYVSAPWLLLGLEVFGTEVLHFFMRRWQRWRWVKQNIPRQGMSRKALLETTAKEVVYESIFA